MGEVLMKNKRFFFLEDLLNFFFSPELEASFDPGIMQKFYSTRLISSLWGEQDKRASSPALVFCEKLSVDALSEIWIEKKNILQFELLN